MSVICIPLLWRWLSPPDPSTYSDHHHFHLPPQYPHSSLSCPLLPVFVSPNPLLCANSDALLLTLCRAFSLRVDAPQHCWAFLFQTFLRAFFAHCDFAAPGLWIAIRDVGFIFAAHTTTFLCQLIFIWGSPSKRAVKGWSLWSVVMPHNLTILILHLLHLFSALLRRFPPT